MTSYEQMLNDAANLEKKAKALREKAEKQKRDAEATAQKEREASIKVARDKVIEAVVAYTKEIGVEIEDKDVPTIASLCEEELKTLEKTVNKTVKRESFNELFDTFFKYFF